MGSSINVGFKKEVYSRWSSSKQESKFWIHPQDLNTRRTMVNFLKCYALLFARGDQQVDGVNYKETDLCAPTRKAAEVLLLMAITVAKGHKTATKLAY